MDAEQGGKLISTKGRYALRVMADLAEQPAGEYVPLREISQRQEISEKYLEAILRVLVREGLLAGRRGKRGGYRLTRDPDEYPVGEILELTEGTLALVACLDGGEEGCERAEYCRTLPMWKTLNGLLRDFLFTTTLADIIRPGDPAGPLVEQ